MILPALIVLACSAPTDTVPFSSGEVAVRGGALLPAGSLDRLFDPAAQGGASLSMAHWGPVRTRLDAAYGHLDGADPLHYALGAAGYDWRVAGLPLELGASLAIFYVQASSTMEMETGGERLTEDGETEFGTTLRASALLLERGAWSVRAELQVQIAFTEPHLSVFGWSGLSLGWRAW